MVNRTTRITLVTVILLHGLLPAVHGALPGVPSHDGACHCCLRAVHEHENSPSHESAPVERDSHHPTSCTLCQAVENFAARPQCTAPTDLTLVWVDAVVSQDVPCRDACTISSVGREGPPALRAVSLPMLN